jgi:putative heme-binding domain-containing protein
MRIRTKYVIPFLLVGFFPHLAFGQAVVAPTDPNTPEQERKTFRLPAGFEAQLVASEPDILKPIQLCFDVKGRLWVTTTTEYPFPAVGRPGKDRLVVLEDFGADGKAKKVTTFADNLNIPIGVCPLPDCKSVIVSSIDPGDAKNKISCWIWKLTDTDGDGKADKFEKLFGPFGVDDTHGMVNSFLLMPDGWVYACHGFRNDSTVKGKDGHEIHMQSGNTFRFRPDGSRIEIWTRGQVNPFGLAVDPYFNLYTADCHSKPITQLIPGAVYESFGKPHDGLGYGPNMINHDHGSTALCGLTWYDADQFPEEYKGTMFLGNVVTNRINFDKIEFVGSTPKAIQKPDFLVSGDLWFRPTDIKLGPDGALYVADFYNKIIGHYEVDLRHPGRDKFRGRVWRIVWKGKDGKAGALKPVVDLTKLSISELTKKLGDANFTTRMLATLALAEKALAIKDNPGKSEETLPKGKNGEAAKDPISLSHFLWAVRPLVIPGISLAPAISSREINSPLQQAHVLRFDNTLPTWEPSTATEIRNALRLPNAQVRRIACEVLAQHLSKENVAPLLELLEATAPQDSHLRHAARVALREQFRSGEAYSTIPLDLKDTDVLAIADVSLGVPSKESAAFLVGHLDLLVKKGDRLPEFVGHAIRYGDEAKTLPPMLELVRKSQAENFGRGIFTFLAIQRAMQQNGKQVKGETLALAEELAAKSLASNDLGVLQAGTEIAGALKLAKLYEPLEKIAVETGRNEAQRLTVLPALANINASKAIAQLGKLLTNTNEAIPIRERSAQILASLNQPAAFDELLKAILIVPARLETTIAIGMASSQPGADRLLKAVEAGKASARLLQEKSVQGKLNDSKLPRWQERVATLTKGLPSADQRVGDLLKGRAASYGKRTADVALGQQVYVKNCAICHQMGGQGAKIGPQLDGVGIRGLDRILEDILDPNRNVDQAFRATTLSLKDGKNLMGLVLRQEGQVIVMADEKGKEVRINMADVDERRQSLLSPMPANFDQAIPEKDFYDLLAYLLSQKAKEK